MSGIIDEEAINTFISITGASHSIALQTLQAHGGDLNEAVDAHFSEGDGNGNLTRRASNVAPQDDAMDIDETIPVGIRAPPFSLLPSARHLDPFSSLRDPAFSTRFFDTGSAFGSSAPFVSHPREVREIPIEFKDGNGGSGNSALMPTIEDVTGTDEPGPETQGVVTIDDDDDDDYEVTPHTRGAGVTTGLNEQIPHVAGGAYPIPSAPVIDDLPDYQNDIEEEMIRAAIEASKKEAEKVHPDQVFGVHDDPRASSTQPSHGEDPALAHAVSLSLKTAEQEKALRELGGSSEPEAYKPTETGNTGKRILLNGRSDVGSSSVQDEDEDEDGQPLVRRRSRRLASANSTRGVEEDDVTPPLSPEQPDTTDHPSQTGNDFSEWGGISSEEHDEAVMLEAAMFGGIPETSGSRFPYAPHHFMQNSLERNSAMYQQQFPRPPSPNLVNQRLIREQQDDEYFASLQADREKAEAQRLEEEAAREASREAERRKEDESRRKLEAEQEIERQLTAKEASLPPEPSSDDENAVTLLVKMPDGSRHGRRFLKSDKLQHLFDFIDVGRGVKPGTYKLVRPYPRRAFSDGESSLSLNELGLTSKQEALFLESIKP